MPPKSKITKEMIIEAGFEVVRTEGEDNLNVRKVAAKLGCSTQPVMYCYETVESLKIDILKRAEDFHTSYIMRESEGNPDPMLGIGLNYIRFADEEKNLFRFLFQSNKYVNTGFTEIITDDGVEPVMRSLCMQAKITEQQAKDAFAMLFIGVHGFASLLANNSIIYDEDYCKKLLINLFYGMLEYMRSERNQENESHNT